MKTSNIIHITLSTFRETIRSKILYSVFFFVIALVALSAFFGSVTLGKQEIVVKNFGLFSIAFFTVAFAVISGASLVYKELSKKTIYNILSKSVSRLEFLLGKYFGMLITVCVMLFLMGLGLILFNYLFEKKFDLLLIQAYFGIFCQLIIVCALAIFFSTIVVTPLLSGAFAFGLFLAGRSTDFMLEFIQRNGVEGGASLGLTWIHKVLPHLNKLDYSDMTVYGQVVSSTSFIWAFLYSIAYAGVLLVLANFFFGKKEFN